MKRGLFDFQKSSDFRPVRNRKAISDVKKFTNFRPVRNRKAISDVVTTVLIILVSIIAVLIAWQFIKEAVIDNTSRLDIPIVTDLTIEDVAVLDGINAEVKLGLGTETKKIDWFAIILSNDGESQTVYYNRSLNSMETIRIKIPLNISGVSKASVSPGFNSKKGVTFSQISDTTTKISKSNPYLIAYYKLDGDANDETGKNNGVVNGADCSVQGVRGLACSFDGNDDNISLGNISLGSNYALSSWLKYSTSPGAIFTSDYSAQVLLRIWASTIYGAGYRAYSAEWPNYNAYGKTTLISGNWYHVVMNVNQTNVSLYLNGNFEGSKLAPDTTLNNNKGKSYLGYAGTPANPQRFSGMIDDFRIFNRTLSLEEINSLYRI